MDSEVSVSDVNKETRKIRSQVIDPMTLDMRKDRSSVKEIFKQYIPNGYGKAQGFLRHYF